MKVNIARDEALKYIAENAGVTQEAAGAVMKEMVNLMTECLVAGGVVAIPNFGSIKVSNVASREGINPQTGDRITLNATHRVSFKASKVLKDWLVVGE
jgi:DNA-binding protein HU-beta